MLPGKLQPALGALSLLPRARLALPVGVTQGACKVIALVAPAGYGKTTLMAQWMATWQENGGACAWLTVDTNDNDPTRFLRHLVAALSHTGVAVSEATLAHLGDSLATQFKSMTESLATDLAATPEHLMLMLDGVHTLHDPTVLDLIGWLLHYAPQPLQIALSSRHELPWRLGSLRVRGLLHELDFRALQFTADEAHQFCQRRLPGGLGPDDITQLVNKTEGWPAALELATMALRSDAHDDTQRAQFIEQFTGTDRGLVDYLGEVLLQHLPESLHPLVMRLSLFSHFDADLARQLSDTDATDSSQQWHQLHALALFLVPLDRHGRSSRFHALVGEFFKSRFWQTDPTQARAVLMRGAQWRWSQGMHVEAIDGALEAQAWEQAAPWLAECMPEVVQRRGELQLALRWMNAMPATWLDRYPTIRIDYAFALSFFPRQAAVAAQMQALQETCQRLQQAAQPDPQAIDQIECALEFQRTLSLALSDQGHAARDAAHAWLARWPQTRGLQRGVIANVLCFGYKCTGEIEAGLQLVHTARGWLEQDHAYYGLVWNATLEALLHLERGSNAAAQQACERGLTLIHQHLGGHRAHASVLNTILAALAYERDELAAAQQHLDQSLDSLAQYGPADALMLYWLTQGRLRFARNDSEGGLAALQEGQSLALQRGLPRVLTTLVAESCSHLSHQGRHAQARALADAHALDGFPLPNASRPQPNTPPAVMVKVTVGTTSSPHDLTRREVGILQRLASGLSNKEIAEALFISEGTLKWHLHNIYGKLGSKNRSGALVQARALGML